MLTMYITMTVGTWETRGGANFKTPGMMEFLRLRNVVEHAMSERPHGVDREQKGDYLQGS